jgi:hypothetical protein
MQQIARVDIIFGRDEIRECLVDVFSQRVSGDKATYPPYEKQGWKCNLNLSILAEY